jgi:ATP-dependent Zn protease
MKNIFLYAKYLAHNRNAKTIGINDLRSSVEVFADKIYKDEKLHKTLLDELSLESISPPEILYVEELNIIINEAKELDKIMFSPSVKKIISSLNQHGFSLKDETISFSSNEFDDLFGDEMEWDTDDVSDENESYEKPEKKKKNASDEIEDIELNDPLLVALNLKKELSNIIYGQDIAIEAVVDSVKNKVVESTNMPSHTFLFLGPPATGKTYMAKTIADCFDGYEYLELNMQEYQKHNDGMKIFGTEAGWSSASPGILTSFVKENPKTVVLLDEFEKAHTNVQKKLLSVFSEGYLNDANGWVVVKDEYDSDQKEEKIYDRDDDDHKKLIPITKVDFTQTVIVITSNLGSSLYNNYEFLDCLKRDYDKAETMIIQSLQNEKKKEEGSETNAIVPEMLSRISQGKIVLFNKLSFKNLMKISYKIFDMKLNQLINRHTHLKLEKNKQFEPFMQCLLLKFAPYMDVRRIKSKIYERFSDQITDCLIENEKTWNDINTISLNVSNEVLDFLHNDVDPKLKNETLLKHLFRKNLTLDLKYELEYYGTNIILTISKASFIKVRKIEDMLGDGSISFDIPETTFEDVAGHESVKGRLKEIANLLKKPEQLTKFGAKIPKGMLLHGVPGTGKTMLARAFANYADLPFIQTTANELIDHGSKNLDFMKKVFARARDYAPAIIFIDEIDVFGRRDRGGSNAMITELLTQIDGFNNTDEEPVFLIAATNHKDNIDSAIIRAKRIELHVEIPTLDAKGREYFINKILEKPCEKNIDVSKLVMYSAGMTGAQLEKISNESSLYALRHQLNLITETIILEQINIEKYGNRITGKSIEEMLGETAYHEAGHAVISKVLNPDTKIEQITVTPREDTLGFVSYDVDSLSSNPSKKDLENKICVAYAGRIAQMKQYGEDGLDTGASNDLKQATRLAYLMTVNFGMDDEIGYINLDGLPQISSSGGQRPEIENLYKDKIEIRIDAILSELKLTTENLVEKNWDKIDKLAQELLDKEVVHEDELNKLMKI